MDGTYRTTHIDSFGKLKYGPLNPDRLHGGRYFLPSIEEERFVWILMDPTHSTDEYFIVENRWGGTSTTSNARCGWSCDLAYYGGSSRLMVPYPLHQEFAPWAEIATDDAGRQLNAASLIPHFLTV